MTPMQEIATRSILSGIVSGAIWFLDEPLTGMDFPVWLCILIALVLVNGGWLIITNINDD